MKQRRTNIVRDALGRLDGALAAAVYDALGPQIGDLAIDPFSAEARRSRSR